MVQKSITECQNTGGGRTSAGMGVKAPQFEWNIEVRQGVHFDSSETITNANVTVRKRAVLAL